MALDADANDLVGIAFPPVLRREDLHIAMPAVARVLHQAAQPAQIDDAVPRHAAVEHEIAGGHQPVADVVGKNARAAARDLARQIRIPVIVSGGVSSLADIAAVKAHEADGIAGVICGRALYDGGIDPEAALRLVMEQPSC